MPDSSTSASDSVRRDDGLKALALRDVAPDNERYLKELVEKARAGRLVPFVGAGMTIPLGLPGWGKALDQIFANAKPSVTVDEAVRYASAKTGNQWEEAAQALWDVESLGARWFNDQIRALFGKHKLPDPITGAVALLPRIAAGPVLTTNFDSALEQVYAAVGQAFTREQTVLGDYRADGVIEDWDTGNRFLLKLHGDADESTGRVLTRQQYDRAYGEGSKLPELLRALFGSRRPLLFLGCSLETDRTLHELKTAGLHQSNAYHFALLQHPSTEEERLKRQGQLISQYGIQPIWFAKGDYAAIERVLQYLADACTPNPVTTSSPSVPATPAVTPELPSVVDSARVLEFLEGLDALSLGRVVLRLNASQYVSPNLPALQQAHELFRYAHSSAGPGLPRLAQELKKLFPNAPPFG